MNVAKFLILNKKPRFPKINEPNFDKFSSAYIGSSSRKKAGKGTPASLFKLPMSSFGSSTSESAVPE